MPKRLPSPQPGATGADMMASKDPAASSRRARLPHRQPRRPRSNVTRVSSGRSTHRHTRSNLTLVGRGQSRLARRPPSHLTARLQALRDRTAASHKREVESRKVAILKEQALREAARKWLVATRSKQLSTRPPATHSIKSSTSRPNRQIFSFPDWTPRGRRSDGRNGTWREFGPAEWPLPHRHDRVFRALSIYVYRLPHFYTRGVWRAASSRMHRSVLKTQQEFCLLRYCHVGWWGGADSREFTAEIPVMLRLLQTATIVRDPAAADAFIVPFSIGTYQTLVRWLATDEERKRLPTLPKLVAELGEDQTNRVLGAGEEKRILDAVREQGGSG